jgi:hypothetical protein
MRQPSGRAESEDRGRTSYRTHQHDREDEGDEVGRRSRFYLLSIGGGRWRFAIRALMSLCKDCEVRPHPFVNPVDFVHIRRWHSPRVAAGGGATISGLRAAVSYAERALSDCARSRRDLPRPGRPGVRGGAPAAVHRGGIRGLPPVRVARRGLCPVSVRRLRAGSSGPVLQEDGRPLPLTLWVSLCSTAAYRGRLGKWPSDKPICCKARSTC